MDGSTRKELCSIDSTITIKMDENIVYVRDGWGTPNEGTYWFKGDYLWEAYIDNELVGSKKFFVEDVGKVTASNNPYFTVESVKLFAGPFARTGCPPHASSPHHLTYPSLFHLCSITTTASPFLKPPKKARKAGLNKL